MGGHMRPWEAMGGNGRPWEAMGSHGRPWEVMGGHGRRWWGGNRRPREAMGGHGRPWATLSNTTKQFYYCHESLLFLVLCRLQLFFASTMKYLTSNINICTEMYPPKDPDKLEGGACPSARPL